MGRVLRVVGLLLIGLGVCIALFPFISTARISSVILDELPDTVSGSSADDVNQYGAPIFDDNFVLATRTYETATVEEVEQALASAGYQRTNLGENLVWSRECCGEWDGATVKVTQGSTGRAVATVSVVDTDVQSLWLVFPIIGLFPFLGGLILRLRNRRRSGGVVWDSVPETSGSWDMGD